MNKRIFGFWGLSLLQVAVAIYFVTKTRFSGNVVIGDDTNSLVKEIGARKSLENDNKWTRCFQMGDGTIFFEDHKMSKDGGKTVIPQNDIDVEEINGASSGQCLSKMMCFTHLMAPLKWSLPVSLPAKHGDHRMD